MVLTKISELLVGTPFPTNSSKVPIEEEVQWLVFE